MHYRREVDGLRALAILPVIIFHAGFTTFSGGFVGVDVFFVISGYLITTILLSELEKGHFSIINFYERRARRILPALFFVMLACLPFAWLLLLPSDMKDFAQSLVAVCVFASNLLFWHKSGYFDSAAELKPLLHTWSLAVEEQYYVFFPLFLMLFWKLGRKWILPILAVVFAASLILAQWAVHANPSAAFYLLPTRGWELLIGGFAAFYMSNKGRTPVSKPVAEVGGWLGVVMISYAVFAYNKTTPFPGLYALLPTLGAVLIIIFATAENTVGRFVGNRVFVFIGLISYSAYLWHQPLFAFARHYGMGHSDAAVFALLALVSFLLAYVSWKYVEAPFRDKNKLSRKAIFIFAFIGSCFFVAAGLYGHKKNGVVGQLSNAQQTFLAYFDNDIPAWKYFTKEKIEEKFRTDCDFYNIARYRSGKETKVPMESISSSCYTPTVDSTKVVFIWGDSHAQQLYFGLSKSLTPGHQVLQVASSGCVPQLGAKPSKIDYCEYSNWFAFDAISKVKPGVVIVAQNLGHELSRMEQFSQALKAAGVQRILFTGPSPHWIPSLPTVAARMLPDVPERTYVGIDRDVLDLDQRLKQGAAGANNFEYISLIDYFCNKEGCVTHYGPDVAASISSWDYGHVAPVASYHLAKELLAPVIEKK